MSLRAARSDRGSMTGARISLDVVICTYNRASELDRVLEALARQRGTADLSWSVLVVDNASTDATPEVVEVHRARGTLPGLERVVETEQGLTPARRRGVAETSGDWVAFVDDDNLLEPDWLAGVAAATQDRPRIGGVGGRVVLDWAAPPPAFLHGFGFCYAEQEHGDEAREVDNLTGAGMVLRRAALAECGWLDQPLLLDRVGRGLVSGGDVEIAQRVRAAGYTLWYTPAAVLRHHIKASRMTRGYLLRANAGLGASETLVSALTWPGTFDDWRRAAWSIWRAKMLWASELLLRAAKRRRGITAALGWTAFALGQLSGIRMVETMVVDRRDALLGAAALSGTRRRLTTLPGHLEDPGGNGTP